MPKKHYRPEEIISKLREVNILIGQGHTAAQGIKLIGVTEATYYRWRQEYGGMLTSQAKRRKDMEKENARLRKAVSDLTPGKLILEEAVKGNLNT